MAIEVKYTPHLVAFLDVMGFKSLVTNPDELSKYFSHIKLKTGHVERSGPVCKIMSDSILVFQPIDTQSDLTYDAVSQFLDHISYLQLMSVTRGFLVRGGMAIGDFFADVNEDILVGPALVSAYYLESECAKFPRILLSPDAVDLCMKNRLVKQKVLLARGRNQRFETHSPLLDALTLDWFCRRVVKFENHTESYMKNIYQLLESGLGGHQDHYEKYRWMADYICNSLLEAMQDDRTRYELWLRWYEHFRILV